MSIKPVAKTTVKLSITNSRLAITVTYKCGEQLKMCSTHSRESIASERTLASKALMPAAEQYTTADLKLILVAISSFRTGENNGQKFERIAKFFETTTSIKQAAATIAA